MKITAGVYKGRNVENRQHRSVRPTTSKVREAIFNILRHGKFLQREDFVTDGGDAVEGRCVVDIFCGSGILGLEAISRGAKQVTLIDENAQTVDIARANAKKLGVHAKVIRSDSTKLPKASTECMLAFLDPPYHSKLAKPALESLRDQRWLSHGAVVVVELSKQEEFFLPENFYVLDDRIYNKTRLMILQYRQ